MLAQSREEMKVLDEWAIRELGIPQIVLMENAGRAVAHSSALEVPNMKTAVVVAGAGKNGGDGFVAARHLFTAGVEVKVFVLAKRSDISGDPKINLEIAEKIGIPVDEIVEPASLKKLEEGLKSSDAVIDAIFGIGFSGRVEGVFAGAIDLINGVKTSSNRKPYYVVSVDIPSGLDADSGLIDPHCVRANLSVTFTYPKTGMLCYPAVDYVGKLAVVDIGIPKRGTEVGRRKTEEAKKKAFNFEIITSDLVAGKIPPRKISANKGDSGEVLIIASSLGMTGAAVMAAKSALRVGAGLVRVGVPESLASFVDSQVPEIVTVPLPETKRMTLSTGALDKILLLYERADVLAVGPGLSTDGETSLLVRKLLKAIGRLDKKIPLILDADGLNAVSDDPSVIMEAKSDVILTPHPGEMSRLSGKSVDDIQRRRDQISKEFSKQYGAIVVLKGARTVVASPKGEVFFNLTGNPAMATAGMGDVLTGAISGFTAQGMGPFDAALAGVYIHGMAGDVIATLKGDRGVLATDLIEALPYVIRSILK